MYRLPDVVGVATTVVAVVEAVVVVWFVESSSK
jgi:hypothetical protein